MPMLFVIQNGYNGVKQVSPEDIVYCITTINEIINCDAEFAFTDGHAVNGLSQFYFEDRVNEVDKIVDFQAVKSKNWNSDFDLDLKRRMEADYLMCLQPGHPMFYLHFHRNL